MLSIMLCAIGKNGFPDKFKSGVIKEACGIYDTGNNEH